MRSGEHQLSQPLHERTEHQHLGHIRLWEVHFYEISMWYLLVKIVEISAPKCRRAKCCCDWLLSGVTNQQHAFL